MSDLEKMIASQIQMYKDYRDKDLLEFLLKYEYNFKDDIIKDYKVYMKDNEDEDPDDLLAYDEWIEKYKEEVSDELYERVKEFFTSYDIDIYKNKEDDYIWDILHAGGGPTIRSRTESKGEKVLLKGYWGGEEVIEDISYLYDTIYDIYNLDL